MAAIFCVYCAYFYFGVSSMAEFWNGSIILEPSIAYWMWFLKREDNWK